jgi:hypothetical protein
MRSLAREIELRLFVAAYSGSLRAARVLVAMQRVSDAIGAWR